MLGQFISKVEIKVNDQRPNIYRKHFLRVTM